NFFKYIDNSFSAEDNEEVNEKDSENGEIFDNHFDSVENGLTKKRKHVPDGTRKK
ncbi:unnamed protein product, partial [Rotaria sordida]